MGKKIIFDLKEFMLWLEDLDETDYPQCSKWDTIKSWYDLRYAGDLVWIRRWENYSEFIEEEVETILKGEILDE